MRVTVLLCAITVVQLVKAQFNTKTVNQFLLECYSDRNLLNRNLLPPMSLSVLLDIIRKIEDHPNSLEDMRQISTGIVHEFRQDGIIYDPTVAVTDNIVPFSPTGFPAYKNILLLNKLIPNNQYELRDGGISAEEKCALHHMVSSSLYLHSRGDEEFVCDSLAINSHSSRLTMFDKSQDIEVFDINGTVDRFGRQIMGTSRCPIETGVVSTRWGDVAMGTIITGISSGLEEQNVQVSDLVTLQSSFNNHSIIVNNRYASTISGDIAEAAIRQGTSLHTSRVGAEGGWNTTNARRHYFVTRNSDLEMTDAEIRGGLDGLVLSELGAAYAVTFPELKLSQLIDMYYSDNGVMHEKRFRACNRKVLIPDIAARQALVDQTLGFAVALYHVSTLSGTTSMAGIQHFVNNTVSALLNYIPQSMNDPICNVTNNQVVRPKINLILVAEPTVRRSQHVSYIIDQLGVGKFGSSISLMHPVTGDIIVERTHSISQFYRQFSKSIVSMIGNLDIVTVLERIRHEVVTNQDEEHSQHYYGGNSTVAVILADVIPLNGPERVVAHQKAQMLRRWVPDLKLVIASTSGSREAVAPLLESEDDFIPVTLTGTEDPTMLLFPLAQYLSILPRRIINPLCGNQWVNENSGAVGFEDYVDAEGINIYRIIPNYFYDNNPSRLIRIQSSEQGALSVCYSRSNTFPRRNTTSSVVPADVTCQSVANGGEVEISLLGACGGASSISACPPLYVTVSSTAIPTEPQCKDFGCRLPNDVKYLVVAHELGCFNSSDVNKMNAVVIIVFMAMLNVFR